MIDSSAESGGALELTSCPSDGTVSNSPIADTSIRLNAIVILVSNPQEDALVHATLRGEYKQTAFCHQNRGRGHNFGMTTTHGPLIIFAFCAVSVVAWGANPAWTSSSDVDKVVYQPVATDNAKITITAFAPSNRLFLVKSRLEYALDRRIDLADVQRSQTYQR